MPDLLSKFEPELKAELSKPKYRYIGKEQVLKDEHVSKEQLAYIIKRAVLEQRGESMKIQEIEHQLELAYERRRNGNHSAALARQIDGLLRDLGNAGIEEEKRQLAIQHFNDGPGRASHGLAPYDPPTKMHMTGGLARTAHYIDVSNSPAAKVTELLTQLGNAGKKEVSELDKAIANAILTNDQIHTVNAMRRSGGDYSIPPSMRAEEALSTFIGQSGMRKMKEDAKNNLYVDDGKERCTECGNRYPKAELLFEDKHVVCDGCMTRYIEKSLDSELGEIETDILVSSFKPLPMYRSEMMVYKPKRKFSTALQVIGIGSAITASLLFGTAITTIAASAVGIVWAANKANWFGTQKPVAGLLT